MILFLTLIYVGILAILIKVKVVPLNTFTKTSPVLFALLLMVGIFIPMQFAAPSGPVVAGRQVVQVVPNVAGRVTEVAAQAYQPMQKGDLLFRIDDRPYRAAVAALEAQLVLAKRRLEQSTELQRESAGSLYEVEAAEAQVKSLEAQLDAALFNLENTEVRAPADGHVTALALREGSLLVAAPLAQAMPFVDESELVVLAQIHQINLRHVAPGQEAEVVFKTRPGRIFKGEVGYVLSDLATGQVAPGGVLPIPGDMLPAPFYVRILLDDREAAQTLETGAVGVAAIYTGEFEVSYLIRRVMIRMDAWLAYIVPI